MSFLSIEKAKWGDTRVDWTRLFYSWHVLLAMRAILQEQRLDA